MIESIRTIPGVTAVGGANHIPLASKQGSMFLNLFVEGRQSAEPIKGSGAYRVISPDYFRAMDMSLLKGRAFTDRDDEKSQRVAVINASLARHLFPGEDPIGKRLLVATNKGKPCEIVGIVADIRNWGLDSVPALEFYLSYLQSPPPFLGLAVRTNGDPRRLISDVRRAVWAVDPDQPLYNVRTMEQALTDSISKQRFSMLMLAMFAGVAFILAIVGVYGVMSYSVAQRTHEIGVRIALGAPRKSILSMVIRRGLLLSIVGVGIGVIAALMLSRFLSSLLFEVRTTDAATYVGASLFLMMVALLACYVPARRATKVDPLVALRCE
jgi:putative ABC transport system permease protein